MRQLNFRNENPKNDPQTEAATTDTATTQDQQAANYYKSFFPIAGFSQEQFYYTDYLSMAVPLIIWEQMGRELTNAAPGRYAFDFGLTAVIKEQSKTPASRKRFTSTQHIDFLHLVLDGEEIAISATAPMAKVVDSREFEGYSLNYIGNPTPAGNSPEGEIATKRRVEETLRPGENFGFFRSGTLFTSGLHLSTNAIGAKVKKAVFEIEGALVTRPDRDALALAERLEAFRELLIRGPR